MCKNRKDVRAMVDDYKYSIGRTVVYGHRDPKRPERSYGQYGPSQTVGDVRAVELGKAPVHVWQYTIENLRTSELVQVPETDVHYAIPGRGERTGLRTKTDAKMIAETLSQSISESSMSGYLSVTVRDLLRREKSEEIARSGRDLPIEAGDYVRVRGDLRQEMESHHNHYAKILGLLESDIDSIRSHAGTYRIKHKYSVLVDDGSECSIYDPEIKLYYTAHGRSTILNWRAATFLAESFHDDPPYSLEYSYLEDHVFTRDDLEAQSPEKLTELYATLLYVKGKMGLRDLERANESQPGLPKELLVDNLLAMSRFDGRKNRNFTSSEIEAKQKELFRLRRLLHGH